MAAVAPEDAATGSSPGRAVRRVGLGARLALGAAAATAGVLLPAQPALAHGIEGSAELPIPVWLFGWAAVAVLIVSFVALGSLWKQPRLQHDRPRPVLPLPEWVVGACGLLGIAILALVVYSGFAGTDDPDGNFAVVFVYIWLWVGVAVASALFGDLFHAFSPWRAIARAAVWAVRRAGREARAPRRYPDGLGRWPAVATIAAFAWLELVFTSRDDPRILAALALAYTLLQLGGMALFGIEAWTRRGDGFGALFGLYARLSPFERREGKLCVRRPLSGAPPLEAIAGTVALIVTAIGATTFDGFSNGPVWAAIADPLEDWLSGLGVGVGTAGELAGTIGLLGCIALVGGLYRLGIAGVKTIDAARGAGQLQRTFVHSLIPIAFAYTLAHYFSLLVLQGQDLIYLASNPLGHGTDYFGTAGFEVDLGLVSAAGIWYVQVAALLGGHLAGLTLAHDRSIALYPRRTQAVRSQYWMLVVMVAFTSLGLWLLSAVNA